MSKLQKFATAFQRKQSNSDLAKQRYAEKAVQAASKRTFKHGVAAKSLEDELQHLQEAFEQFSKATGEAISQGVKKSPAGGEMAVSKVEVPAEFESLVRPGSRLVWAKWLENRTSRQAEYTVMVTQDTGIERYRVVRYFGKLGATQQETPLPSTFVDVMGAVSKAEEQVRAKTSGDYVEVSSYDVLHMDSNPDDWGELLEEDPLPSSLAEDEVIQPARDCKCYALVEETGSTMWNEPEELTPDLAPLLLNESFGMVELPLEPGARWLVGFDASCAPGYDHVRAYPIGPALDSADTPRSQKRNRPQWVEEVVRKNLSSSYSKRTHELFALVVEEQVTELVVIDALLWNAIDPAETSFIERRGSLTAQWSAVFPSTFGLKLAPLHTSRLREIYLGMGDQFRYELVDLKAPVPSPTWRMPTLEPIEE